MDVHKPGFERYAEQHCHRFQWIVLVGGGGAQIVDNMAVVLASASALTQFYGPYYVFGATPIALPTPRPSAIAFRLRR